MQRIHQVRTAERRCNRHGKAFGKARYRRARILRPPAAAKEDERALRRPQYLLQLHHVGEAGPDFDRLKRQRICNREAVALHVFRQRDHDRAGPAAGRDVKRMGYDFRNARRIVDLRHPLCDRAEHRAIIEFLKRLALAHIARDLPDEQDHRRRILLRDMQTRRGVGRAWPARGETNTGPAGRLADGFRHHRRSALLPANGDLQTAGHETHQARRDNFRPARRTHAPHRER